MANIEILSHSATYSDFFKDCVPLTIDHLLARLEKLQPADVSRDIHIDGEVQPFNTWPREALALLYRVHQLGRLGTHILAVRGNSSPERTVHYFVDSFVLEAVTALQCSLMNELRPLIPVAIEQK